MKENRGIHVLLIGENERNVSRIAGQLEADGCECRFADSYQEATRLALQSGFDLVLSVLPPSRHAIYSLAHLLAGTRASFYLAHRVEVGSWWLPALQFGVLCLGAPALRPSEFSNLLGKVVEKLRASRLVKPKDTAEIALPPKESLHPQPSLPEVKALAKRAD